MYCRKVMLASRTGLMTNNAITACMLVGVLMLLSACQPAAIAWLSVPNALDGGEVWIDGELRTAIKDRVAMFDLTSGQHEIVVKKPGFKSIALVVNHDEEL